MPFPPEYERAGQKFMDFLGDIKLNADFGSRHMAYTMAQGVFQVFRRRLSLSDAIRFSNILPAGIRALFVADWDPSEKKMDFEDLETMNQEVKKLRPNHNFSTDAAITDVAKALKKHVDIKKFISVLEQLPEEAKEFWFYDE